MLNLAANSSNGAKESSVALCLQPRLLFWIALSRNLPEQWTTRFCLRARRPFFP